MSPTKHVLILKHIKIQSKSACMIGKNFIAIQMNSFKTKNKSKHAKIDGTHEN